MADPPPYESVMQGDENQFFSTGGGGGGGGGGAAGGADQSSNGYAAPQREIDVSVSQPRKLGEGMGTFVAYSVTSGPANGSSGRAPHASVVRRFRDFTWLAAKLQDHFKGVIVPPLPEKSTVQKLQMTNEFIESRRRTLQVFVNKVAAHPVLREAPELATFLRAPDESWQLEMARWAAETSAATLPAMGTALSWFKSLQHSASNMVSGRSDDAMEDPEYVKVRDYIASLEGHVSEVQRQVARLGRKESELAAALSAFGSAGEALGKFDDGSLRGCFDVLSARAGQIAAASRKRCEDLLIEFEEPLHEATRAICSVQVAMAARSHALSAYVQAKGDFETKKIRLAKLRGTPGLKEEKLSEAERDVNVAEQQVRNTKLEYDTIASRMTEELNRFQKERASDMAGLMRNFAVTQAAFAAENARGWNALLEDIQGQLGEPAAAFG